jgi:hypothetical protein
VRAGSVLILDYPWISAVRRRPLVRRKPRGSPDNSTFHPRPAVCCIAIGKNSRISRRCTALPACRIANTVLSPSPPRGRTLHYFTPLIVGHARRSHKRLALRDSLRRTRAMQCTPALRK